MKNGRYENTIGEVGHLLFEPDNIRYVLITIKDYAEMCELSPETVRRHLDTGLLIGMKVGNLWFVQIIDPDMWSKP